MKAMELRSFEAPSIREAFSKVRREFGPDALIVRTRQLSRRLGLIGSTPTWEITAGSTHSGSRHPSYLEPVVTYLKRAQLPPRWIDRCVAALSDVGHAVADPHAAPVVQRLIRLVQKHVTVAASAETQFADRALEVLVGPSGVGKTTTLIKLAAIATCQFGKRVAIASLDHYRMGAADELRRCAEILEIPCALVANAVQLREAIIEWARFDVVFVDTASRHVWSSQWRQALADATDRTILIHLVLPASMSETAVCSAVMRFAPSRFQRLIVTKLDEIEPRGSLLRMFELVGAPVSFVAFGPKTPGDLEPADGAGLARLALGYDLRGDVKNTDCAT
jgi:flagellar biosynthesis GTPase FlhF